MDSPTRGPVMQTPERLAWMRDINANPRDRLKQLVFADWLEERDDPAHRFYRQQTLGSRGLGGLGSRGLGGLGSRGGLGGLGGLGSRGGLGCRGGLGGLGGLGCRGGLGGLGGRGLIDLLSPEQIIMLIPGENVLVFLPDGYGCAVVVGTVANEYPTGWIVDPCREVIDTHNGACWVELAKGKRKTLRSQCQYGEPIEGGMRVPVGCYSILWHGDLP